ncbi:MAG: hypothetical protein AMJ46_12050 [Latescibacteria bacterium DG_63]|nr:MAG: hypothetical protein AMJ46_12050 [Latescibacteria bacterium DG_63]
MKSVILILTALFIGVPLANADVYLRHEVHTDGYYYGGENTPPRDRTYEVWIGEKKMAVLYEHRTIIFDLNRNMLTFINVDDSTYAETTLPLDWSNLLSEEEAARVRMFQTVGIVGETEETMEIDGRECEAYELTTWIPYEGSRYNETDTNGWLTADLPFDVETYEELEVHNLRLQNMKEELLEEVTKKRGYPIALEDKTYVKGFSVRTTNDVVEIAEKDAPAGVYSAPEGFTKKEKLSLGDLMGR